VAKAFAVRALLEEFSAPSVAFSLERGQDEAVGKSKLGGIPDLPQDFRWQTRDGEATDFLLQINLAQASALDQTGSLPKSGLLSFFYDLKEQPWGFDPKQLHGFLVHYTPDGVTLGSTPMPRPEFALDECQVNFRAGWPWTSHASACMS